MVARSRPLVFLLFLHRVWATPEECRVWFPRIIIGTWKIFERNDHPHSVFEYLEEFIRANFTTFDTADIYGYAEDMLGSLRGKYPQLQIFTKYVTQDSQFMAARGITHLSRQKLNMETLDLVQFHWWHFSDRRYVQTMQNLQWLQSDGAIKELGVTNFDVHHLKDIMKKVPIVSNQVQYSLLDRRVENRMLQYAQENNIVLLCYGAVAGGLLSDTFLGLTHPEQAAELLTTASRRMYWTSLRQFTNEKWDVFQHLLTVLRSVADDLAVPGKKPPNIATVAIAWVLDRLDATCGGSVILGVRDAAHLDDALLAQHLRLDQSHRDRIHAALDRGQPPDGDVWQRERDSESYG